MTQDTENSDIHKGLQELRKKSRVRENTAFCLKTIIKIFAQKFIKVQRAFANEHFAN
jgi:hypothetical protein